VTLMKAHVGSENYRGASFMQEGFKDIQRHDLGSFHLDEAFLTFFWDITPCSSFRVGRDVTKGQKVKLSL
jgi:hypothetical protein